jgi:hypothetical protein
MEVRRKFVGGGNKNVPIIVLSSSENEKQFLPLSLLEHESWNDFILPSEDFQHLLQDGECPTMTSYNIVLHVHFY